MLIATRRSGSCLAGGPASAGALPCRRMARCCRPRPGDRSPTSSGRSRAPSSSRASDGRRRHQGGFGEPGRVQRRPAPRLEGRCRRARCSTRPRARSRPASASPSTGTEVRASSASPRWSGHVFPVWRRFKGGRGVATGAGVFLVVYPVITIVLALVWVLIARGLHKASVASLGVRAHGAGRGRGDRRVGARHRRRARRLAAADPAPRVQPPPALPRRGARAGRAPAPATPPDDRAAATSPRGSGTTVPGHRRR